jgi:hypothetical protein
MPQISIEGFESVPLSAPQLDPGGPYTGKIVDTPKLQTSENSGKQYLEVRTQVLEGPQQEEADPATGSKDPAGVTFSDRYYTSKAASFRLKQLLVACGILDKNDTESPMAKGNINSDILAGAQYKFNVRIQMNNGREFRNYEPIVQ